MEGNVHGLEVESEEIVTDPEIAVCGLPSANPDVTIPKRRRYPPPVSMVKMPHISPPANKRRSALTASEPTSTAQPAAESAVVVTTSAQVKCVPSSTPTETTVQLAACPPQPSTLARRMPLLAETLRAPFVPPLVRMQQQVTRYPSPPSPPNPPPPPPPQMPHTFAVLTTVSRDAEELLDDGGERLFCLNMAKYRIFIERRRNGLPTARRSADGSRVPMPDGGLCRMEMDRSSFSRRNCVFSPNFGM